MVVPPSTEGFLGLGLSCSDSDGNGVQAGKNFSISFTLAWYPGGIPASCATQVGRSHPVPI